MPNRQLESGPSNRTTGRSNQTRPGAIEIRDLHKSFGPLEVLKGVSLDAHDGDVISIIGSSGSGKSTLLRCINLLETPDSGTINDQWETIAMRERRGHAEPADRHQVDRIRSQLGMVFRASISESHMTVLQNVSRRRSMPSCERIRST